MDSQTFKSAAKPTYGFRLKLHFPPGRIFSGVHPRHRLQIGTDSGKVYLVKLPQPKRNRFGARTRYAVVGKEFSTHSAALDAGTRIRTALTLFAVERRIGIDAQDKQGASFSQAIKDELAAKHGVQLRDDVHGLDVFAEDRPVTRFTIESYVSVTHKIENYDDSLLAYFNANPELSKKQKLALDLYNLSHFDGVSKTRFLTLITVIEVLSARKSRSNTIQNIIKTLLASVPVSGLPPKEMSVMCEGLINLKKQSINEACKEFVARYASEADVMYFTNCYKARSDLVHNGHTKLPESMEPMKLDELVSRLLIRSIVNPEK
jgi:hypothetical protein